MYRLDDKFETHPDNDKKLTFSNDQLRTESLERYYEVKGLFKKTVYVLNMDSIRECIERNSGMPVSEENPFAFLIKKINETINDDVSSIYLSFTQQLESTILIIVKIFNQKPILIFCL